MAQEARRVSNTEINVDAIAYDSKWHKVPNAGAKITSHGAPVLVQLVPQSRKMSVSGTEYYNLRIVNPSPSVHGRWEFRYILDANSQVALFSMGATSETGNFELGLPLNAVALDSPKPGMHVYTLEIRYTGDFVKDGSPELHIHDARLCANEL